MPGRDVFFFFLYIYSKSFIIIVFFWQAAFFFFVNRRSDTDLGYLKRKPTFIDISGNCGKRVSKSGKQLETNSG